MTCTEYNATSTGQFPLLEIPYSDHYTDQYVQTPVADIPNWSFRGGVNIHETSLTCHVVQLTRTSSHHVVDT